MTVSPMLLSQVTNASWRQQVRLVATDIDGTLTRQGRLDSRVLKGFETLTQANIAVLLVTGRSAGWVNGLTTYLPVSGAIAENGGMFYRGGQEASGRILGDIPDFASHRQQLRQIFEALQQIFPQIVPSVDNAFRLTDWTFENTGFTVDELQQMKEMCDRCGWGFTYSSIQCHIKPMLQAKGRALKQVLANDYGGYEPERVVTVGDSPNDESLFDPTAFPHSVGVANLFPYLNAIAHLPAYGTSGEEADGFCEFVEWLLGA
jgi:hypothetical protein